MILGLCGKMGAGKDTLAEVLIDKFNFKRVAFADSLKNICSKAFDIDNRYFHDRDLKDKPFEQAVELNTYNLTKLCEVIKECNIKVTDTNLEDMIKGCAGVVLESPRKLLQYIGTDCCRMYIDDSIWLKIGLNEVKNNIPNVVITDVRFPNEKLGIKSMGGKVGLIRRVNNDLINPQSNHTSEMDTWTPDDYDFLFSNDDELGSFKESIEIWYKYRLKSYEMYSDSKVF